MQTLTLVPPAEGWREEVESYKQSFLGAYDSLDGTGGLGRAESFQEWLSDLRDNAREETVHTGLVTASTFLGVRLCDNRLVGMVDIRHRLNDHLLRFGGHVGYSVRPDERRKGYAKELLGLALEQCAKLGINPVLVTCDRENIASAKTISANGGVLENEVPEEDRVTRRYWIYL